MWPTTNKSRKRQVNVFKAGYAEQQLAQTSSTGYLCRNSRVDHHEWWHKGRTVQSKGQVRHSDSEKVTRWNRLKTDRSKGRWHLQLVGSIVVLTIGVMMRVPYLGRSQMSHRVRSVLRTNCYKKKNIFFFISLIFALMPPRSPYFENHWFKKQFS